MHAVFDHVEVVAAGISTFWFRPTTPVRYQAGQFIELYLPHAPADARGERREFSLSSSPHEPLLAFTTNFAFTRGSTFKRALQTLKPGEKVAFNEPMGDFVLPKDPAVPLVFVAAGLGCTPYVSMVKWLNARGDKRTIQMIYAVSRPEDFVFTEFWQNYPLEYIPIVSRPTSSWHGQTGKLSVAKLLELIGLLGDKSIYLAGPQSLIEPLFNNLLESGLSRSQLLLDYFPGY